MDTTQFVIKLFGSSLNFYRADGLNEYEYWTSLGEFVKYLKKNKLESEKKNITVQVVWKEISKYGNSLHEETLQENQWRRIPLKCIIQYMCHHTDDFSVCKRFLDEIQSLILKNQIQSVSVPDSVFEIYQKIVKKGLKQKTRAFFSNVYHHWIFLTMLDIPVWQRDLLCWQSDLLQALSMQKPSGADSGDGIQRKYFPLEHGLYMQLYSIFVFIQGGGDGNLQ